MLRLSNIKMKPGFSQEELLATVRKSLGNVSAKDISFRVSKQSVDARKKDEIRIVLSVDIRCRNEEALLKRHIKNLQPVSEKKYVIPETGSEELRNRPVIIGSGPCGLFCAYYLAKQGYRPLVIERGGSVEDREKAVEAFFNGSPLNPSSNVQFGEGGAGTFSDGKLNTMVSDREGRIPEIFGTFVENGAPEEILYINKPHIGTDVLKTVVVSMRKKIESLGGGFLFDTKLVDFETSGDSLSAVILEDKNGNRNRIETDVMVLAIGHSARDTFEMLERRGVTMHQKAFAMGVRVMHDQELIDRSQYGGRSQDLKLPVADYKLTYTTGEGRAVYSFCMCPGGFVVNASSEEGRLCVNGMSYSKRDSGFANSALVVSVTPDDYASYGSSALAGVALQRELEEKMYSLAGGKIPVQSYKNFKEKSGCADEMAERKLESSKSFAKGECCVADLNDGLPQFICRAICEAMPEFGRKIRGFDNDDALFFGIEARTSSPVHIDRDDNMMCSVRGIYPAGEGAGYAGGITSAAIDGLRVFEEIAGRYRPFTE